MNRRLRTTATSPIRKKTRDLGKRLTYLCRVHTDGRPGSEVEWFELGQEKKTIGRETGEDLITIDDPEASRKHAEIDYLAETGAHRLRDLGSRNRTYLDGRRIDSDYLKNGSVVRTGGSLFVYVDLVVDDSVGDLVLEGVGAIARRSAEAMIDLAAPSALPILIRGPTGAGKELLAQRVHEQSGRSGPFVAVNCATFTRELIASELFGHVSGAFSGASGSRGGLFVSANGGTIFLDEIAELPAEQQPALLRVLQEGRVRPVGSDREVPVDVRVVSATHKDLIELEEKGSFRADLLARLAGFMVELPGLSERREEILGLFAGFVGRRAAPLTADAAEALLLYSWPLNVRELKHAAERMTLLSRGKEAMDVGVLPPEVRRIVHDASEEDDDAPTKEQLSAMLGAHDGNIAHVARALGKHRQQVYRWLKRYDLDATKFRSEPES